MTDAQLVQQVLQGQSSAYEVLVQRWSARLVAYLRVRVRRPDVTEDLAQDCLLRAYRSLASLEDREKFGSWLLSIAHRAVLDWQKSKARDEVPMSRFETEEAGSYEWPAADESPDAVVQRREEHASAMQQIMSLPAALRDTVLLYYLKDYTYESLADVMGVSSATINARLTKARQLLRSGAERSESAS